MENKERYSHDINHGNPYYRISIEGFKKWLDTEQMQDEFNRMLRDRDLTLYDIACDFSKELLRELNEQ